MKVEASKQVNRLGKYIYEHTDSAYDMKKSANTCDVYLTLYYQIPYLQRIPGRGPEYNKMHEMIININITTYMNKLRVNIIEVDPERRTLGYDLYEPELVDNLEKTRLMILSRMRKRISKAYQDYDFVF